MRNIYFYMKTTSGFSFFMCNNSQFCLMTIVGDPNSNNVQFTAFAASLSNACSVGVILGKLFYFGHTQCTYYLSFVITAKILPVVRKQHLLLCTLLICNAAAMEVHINDMSFVVWLHGRKQITYCPLFQALPIFLDSLVTAWGAILISVTLILLFGEVRKPFSFFIFLFFIFFCVYVELVKAGLVNNRHIVELCSLRVWATCTLPIIFLQPMRYLYEDPLDVKSSLLNSIVFKVCCLSLLKKEKEMSCLFWRERSPWKLELHSWAP